MRRHLRPGTHVAAMLLFTALPACSVRKMAVNSVGNALAEGGSFFSSEEDPELAREAAPFSLKIMESLLEEAPRHRGLLLAGAGGFTRYAFAFVQQDADFLEAKDLASATALRQRAGKLYLRAREYGMRGLEVDSPDFSGRLRTDRPGALASLQKRHVPLLYWTAASWAAAMALDKSDSSLTADQEVAEAMMRRALELDERFELGSIHDFFISYEAGRASVGGSVERARQHFERSVALSQGQRAWPYVSFAESASVSLQDRAEFERLLKEALAIDPNRLKTQRLANILAQRRARWLLSRADELFVE
jgi:predicted anti-sigma-YlaC factor YlaD